MRVLVLLLVLIALSLSTSMIPVTHSATISFSKIVAPQLYIADFPAQTKQVWLYLFQNNYFVLKQIQFANGKSLPTIQITGRWRQVDNGAHVQLTNTFGLELSVDVGTEGVLYGTIQNAQPFSMENITLKPVPFRSDPYRMSGILAYSDGQLVLTDSAAEHSFSPVVTEVDEKSGKHPRFVEVEVSQLKEGIRIERILSETAIIPSSVKDKKQEFTTLVVQSVWQVDSGPGISEATCVFHQQGSHSGTLEVSGRGLRVEMTYQYKKKTLFFVLPERVKQELLAIGENGWLDLTLGPVAWRNEGTVLVLRAQSGRLIQFRRVGE